MLYFGQEAGERGMEQEGFSGLNGRTTIFDWWCPKSVRDIDSYVHTGKGLSREEKAVLKKYCQLLEYSQEDIIRRGGTYDLQYCNAGSEGFDTARHYAFLRVLDGHIHLIVANFSSTDADVYVNIPEEAFAWAGIPDGRPQKINVKVGAHDGAIVKYI